MYAYYVLYKYCHGFDGEIASRSIHDMNSLRAFGLAVENDKKRLVFRGIYEYICPSGYSF